MTESNFRELDSARILRDLSKLQASSGPEVPVELRAAVESLERHIDAQPRKLRRGAVVVSIGAALAIGGVGLGVAAIVSRQPDRPDQAPACRDAPIRDSNIVALAPGDDALSRCGELWADGTITSPMHAPNSVPPLVACIGQGGIVEVFPGPPTLCGELGLDPASPTPDPGTNAVSDLTNRITDELNLADCVDVAGAIDTVDAILRDVDLAHWTIDNSSVPADSICVKAEVDAATTSVRLFVL